MFTGIVESQARIVEIADQGTNRTFTLSSSITTELKIDQSVSHNGVCLTVAALEGDTYKVTAVEETLLKTNLGDWQLDDEVNMERCMPANGRFDGHIVQGHVDQTAVCTNIEERDGSWLYDFSYDEAAGNITVEKGSICINGVSLTVFNSAPGAFRVTIIPYTHEFTNFNRLKQGDRVNLEFDILGKYMKRILNGYQS